MWASTAPDYNFNLSNYSPANNTSASFFANSFSSDNDVSLVWVFVNLPIWDQNEWLQLFTIPTSTGNVIDWRFSVYVIGFSIVTELHHGLSAFTRQEEAKSSAGGEEDSCLFNCVFKLHLPSCEIWRSSWKSGFMLYNRKLLCLLKYTKVVRLISTNNNLFIYKKLLKIYNEPKSS